MAVTAGAALVALVEARLPLKVAPLGAPEPMRVYGPAMLARAAGTVQAINRLAPLRRSADIGVLVRVLLEHVITFAWLAADNDNERFGLWMKGDSKHRLTMHYDQPGFVGELLPPEHLKFYEGIAKGIDGALPSLRDRAQRADLDWAPRIPHAVKPDTEWACFVGLYRIVYRYLSGFTHATAFSLDPVLITSAGGADIIAMESDSGDSAIALAPTLLGLGLYVACETMGWPARNEIDTVIHQPLAAG